MVSTETYCFNFITRKQYGLSDFRSYDLLRLIQFAAKSLYAWKAIPKQLNRKKNVVSYKLHRLNRKLHFCRSTDTNRKTEEINHG